MGQEIVYCSRCQVRIVGSDFEKGDAFRVGEQSACSRCAMDLLATAPLAVQQQILEQKKRVLDRKIAPPAPALSRGLTGSSTQVRQTTPAEGPSRTSIAVLAGIGLTLVLLVGMVVMSSKPPPAPAPAPKSAETGPSAHELAAQGALKVAISYAREHPGEFDEPARMFEKIASEYARTPAAGEAKRELEAIARRRREAVAAELATVLSRSREMAAGTEYQKAVDALEAARKKNADPLWTRPIDEKLKEYSDAMAKEFPGQRDRAVDARKRGAASELHLVRTQVERWGSARYKEELEAAILTVVPPIAAKEDGSLRLRVADATLQGNVKFRRTTGEWNIIQGWGSEKDYLEWTAAPRHAGPYTLKLNYACPKEMKTTPFGGQFSVSVAGGESKTFTVEYTADWGDFKTITFGTLTLPGSPCVISVRPVKIQHSLMSLHYLELVPAK